MPGTPSRNVANTLFDVASLSSDSGDITDKFSIGENDDKYAILTFYTPENDDASGFDLTKERRQPLEDDWSPPLLISDSRFVPRVVKLRVAPSAPDTDFVADGRSSSDSQSSHSHSTSSNSTSFDDDGSISHDNSDGWQGGPHRLRKADEASVADSRVDVSYDEEDSAISAIQDRFANLLFRSCMPRSER